MSAALATLKEAISMAGRNGDQFWFPRIPNCIGWIHRELQDFEGAFKRDREGLEVGTEYHVLEAEANSLINLGIDYTHSGKPAETEAAFHQAREIFKRDAWFRWRYDIRLQAATSQHWLGRGDLSKAREFAERLRATATHYGVAKYVAEAHRLLAKIAIAAGDCTTGESEFMAALAELQEHPTPVVTWRIYSELGRLKDNLGDRAGVRDWFVQANEIVDAIAASITNAGLQAVFLNSEAVREVKIGAGKPATSAAHGAPSNPT